MPRSFFVSDLHGRRDRYSKLFAAVRRERPGSLFLGGDLFPHEFHSIRDAKDQHSNFPINVLKEGFESLREELKEAYPSVFVILGNDDLRVEESVMAEGETAGLWKYMHLKRASWRNETVLGYACVPPTPFRLKDWERYDVSRFVDPGCVSPEEGLRSVDADANEVKYGTIEKDLERLAGTDSLDRAILLFHSPPYKTKLDRAALDGKMVDHVPLDVHVGSIAIRDFIERRQPLLALHGHVHESARLTGSWKDQIGDTLLFSAAHDGPELALVRFDVEHPADATRELI